MIHRIVLQDPNGLVYPVTGRKYGVPFTDGVSEPLPRGRANTIWANSGRTRKYTEAQFQDVKDNLRFRNEDGSEGDLIFGEEKPEHDEDAQFSPPIAWLENRLVSDLEVDVTGIDIPDDFNERRRYITRAAEATGFPYKALNGGDGRYDSTFATKVYAYLWKKWLPSGDIDPHTFTDEVWEEQQAEDSDEVPASLLDGLDDDEEAAGNEQ